MKKCEICDDGTLRDSDACPHYVVKGDQLVLAKDAHKDNEEELEAVCDGCGKRGPVADFDNEIRDFWGRVEVGGEMPVGECPDEDCGALAYLDTPELRAKRAGPELLAALKDICGAADNGQPYSPAEIERLFVPIVAKAEEGR